MTDHELIKRAKAKAAKEWRQKNSAKVKEYHKRWREQNRDKVKVNAKRWRDNHPDKVQAANNKFWLKKAIESSALDKAIAQSQNKESATNEMRQGATSSNTLDNEIVQLKQEQPQLSNRAIARQLNTNDNRVRRVLKRKIE